jgi:hypothetical protein
MFRGCLLSAAVTHPSHFLTLCEQVRDLRRQHQHRPIIPLYELSHDLSSLLGLIFVQEMASVREDLQLKLACTKCQSLLA